jgi:ABC-2 type transport system ATP-binding protein
VFDETMRNVLLCRELRKSYGDLVAVDGVGFTIAEGETYGLLGPNGAGKTTTISMIAGVLRRDAGDVLIGDALMTASSVRLKASIGYVPQEIALYPDLSGRENMRFFAQLYGMRRQAARTRIDEVLGIVGLTERAKDLVSTYSGGMRRRLNIGVGLLHRPRLLILDEPTAGVDPQSRNAILDNVTQLAGEGIAILYTTHYMEEAERLCDRVGIIDAGKLIAEGTSRELVALVGERDRVSLTITGDAGAATAALGKLSGVQQAGNADSQIQLLVDDASGRLPQILDVAAGGGVAIRSVSVVEPDLESVFLHLTGKALRD